MKFVKGDAIASLVIIVVNLVGGMAIGCLQRGMSFAEAVQTYSLLAVGDGLIAQIPALLISLTAGVIVTRVTSEEGGNLGRDIVSQLTGEPRTLQISAVVLAALALVPGFPAAVFLTLAIILGAVGWGLARQARRAGERSFAEARRAERATPEPASLTIRLGGALQAQQDSLEDLPRQIGTSLGVTVPRLRVALDETSGPHSWRLDVNGVPSGSGTEPETMLAEVRQALLHIAGQFVGIQETQTLLNGMETGYADLLREAAKVASLPRLAEVLRRLLDEQVSIGNLRAILEAVAEWGGREANTAILAEHARVALRRQICYSLAGPEKILAVVLVDGPLDEALRALVHATPAGTQLVLDPAGCERLLTVLRQLVAPAAARANVRAAVLASSEIRRHLRALLNRQGFEIAVLTHAELAQDFKMDVLGTLRQAQVLAPTSMRTVRETPHLVAVGNRS